MLQASGWPSCILYTTHMRGYGLGLSLAWRFELFEYISHTTAYHITFMRLSLQQVIEVHEYLVAGWQVLP